MTLPEKQFCGTCVAMVRFPTSLFVGLPKKPLWLNVLPVIASLNASNAHSSDPKNALRFVTPCPEHEIPGGGVSESANGRNSAPHEPLLANKLFMTVSLRPPDSVIPVPTGPAPAKPAPLPGTFGLLLSCTKLFMKTQHDGVPVKPLTPL